MSEEIHDLKGNSTTVRKIESAPKLKLTKVDHLSIALRLLGMNLPAQTLDLILVLADKVEKKGGEFSLTDAVEIDNLIKDKYKK